MEKRIIDFVLVPSGFFVMVTYHIWLFYWIVKHPNRTVVGINAVNRRYWVRAMMEDQAKNGVLAVQTLRNNIMASTLLASTAIMLSSLIAVLMSNGSMKRSSYFVFGDTSELGFSIKFFSILVCFLVSFLLNVQSIRYYSHASILINVPYQKMSASYSHGNSNSRHQSSHHHPHLEFVATTVNRGSFFWSLGLRAFYFSFPLFLWLFGPIPMFVCCIAMVFMLYFLDATFEFGVVLGASEEDRDVEQHGS